MCALIFYVLVFTKTLFTIIVTECTNTAAYARAPTSAVGGFAPTGVNPAGDAGDTSPNIFSWGDVNWNIPPILLRTFGYSRPILVALRSLSLERISFGYKTPPVRFSQAGGQSAHKARPPNLELALTPLLAPAPLLGAQLPDLRPARTIFWIGH